MKQVQIHNQSRPLGRPLYAEYCTGFWCRLRGLAWRRSLDEERALVMAYGRPSRSGTAIHMLGMFFDLAIVWLDEERRVLDVQPAYRWRSFLQPAKAACYVIECGLNRLEEFHSGDQIAFETASRP